MASLRSEAEKLGLTVGYDDKTRNVTVGDKTYTPQQLQSSGLSLVNGSWQGNVASLLPTVQKTPTVAQNTATSSKVYSDTKLSAAPKVDAMQAITTPSYQDLMNQIQSQSQNQTQALIQAQAQARADAQTQANAQAETQRIEAQRYAEQLAEAKKSQTIASLQNAYQQSVGGIAKEQAAIEPMYDQARSQARTTATMKAKEFENFLAQRGLTSSGSAAQGDIAQNVALQGSLTGINQGQNQAMSDIEARKQQLASTLEFNKAQAGTDYDINMLQSMDAERIRQAQLAEQQRKENLSALEREQQQLLDLSNSTKKEEMAAFLDTIGRFSNDYQAQINKVQNDGDTTNDWQIPYLQSARQDKITTQETAAQKDEEKKVQDFLSTITRYYGDYQAQANKVRNDGDATNDWQIPYLEAARQEKIANEGLTQSGQRVQSAPELTSSSALSLWEQLGTANQAVAAALGVPVGTRYQKQSSGGGSSSGSGSGGEAKISDYVAVIKQQGMDTNQIQAYLENLSLAGVPDETVIYLGKLYGLVPMSTQDIVENAGSSINTVPRVTPTISLDQVRKNLMGQFYMQ